MIPYEYEEGTFIPKVGGYSESGPVGDIDYRVHYGTYRKIGKTVFVEFRMAITSMQNMKGALALFDFPYQDKLDMEEFSMILTCAGEKFSDSIDNVYKVREHRLYITKNSSNQAVANLNFETEHTIFGAGFYFIK